MEMACISNYGVKTLSNYQVAHKWGNISISTQTMNDMVDLIEKVFNEEYKKSQSILLNLLSTPLTSKNTFEFNVSIPKDSDFYKLFAGMLTTDFGRKLVSTLFLLNGKDIGPCIVQILEDGDVEGVYFMHITKFLTFKSTRALNKKIFETPYSYAYYDSEIHKQYQLFEYINTLNKLYGFNLELRNNNDKMIVVINDIASKVRKIARELIKDNTIDIDYDDPETQILFLRGTFLRGAVNVFDTYRYEISKYTAMYPTIELLENKIKLFKSREDYEQHSTLCKRDDRQIFEDGLKMILARLSSPRNGMGIPADYYCDTFDVSPANIMKNAFTDEGYNAMQDFIDILKYRCNKYAVEILTKALPNFKKIIGLTNPAHIAIDQSNVSKELNIPLSNDVVNIFKQSPISRNYQIYLNNIFRHLIYFNAPLIKAILPYYNINVLLDDKNLKITLKDPNIVDYTYINADVSPFKGWNAEADNITEIMMYLLSSKMYRSTLLNKITPIEYLVNKEEVSINLSYIKNFDEDIASMLNLFANMIHNPEIVNKIYNQNTGEFELLKLVEENKYYNNAHLISKINDIVEDNIFLLDHKDLFNGLKEINKTLVMILEISDKDSDVIIKFKIKDIEIKNYAVAG